MSTSSSDHPIRTERARLTHSIARMRAVLDGLERGLGLGGIVGNEAAQAVTQTATEIAMQISRLDAYERIQVELDNLGRELADARQRVAVLDELANPDFCLR